MTEKNNIIFMGTSSNAGKSFITGFIGKILKENLKINVGPFKAQNMSNYASVTDENKEIAIAQYCQAELINTLPKADMSAIMLKPIGEGRSQVVIRGIPDKITTARQYYEDIETLKSQVDEAYNNLNNAFDLLVIEGAGSGFELNLKHKDLANQHMMQKDNVNTILVANIEMGGVFPAIYGAINLMTTEEREKLKGVIINNFRGDITLFDEGIKIIENWGVPVLGVIPHVDYNVDSEDSLAEMKSHNNKFDNVVKIGVIKYPRTSNINDVEPLVHDPNVQVTFINHISNLNSFDKIILPGSRSVLDDLRWLKQTGLYEALQNTTSEIYGICGGYQMMHREILDTLGTENAFGKTDKETGLGFIDGVVEYKENKILLRQIYSVFDNIEIDGFEMHTGISDNYPIYFDSPGKKGSIIHEIFHNDNFRLWWLRQNNNLNLQEWNYKAWKKSYQDNISKTIKKHLHLEKLMEAI